MVVEFASNGDLLGFLRKTRGLEDPYYNTDRRALNLTANDLLKFAKAIANGMSHLSASGVGVFKFKMMIFKAVAKQTAPQKRVLNGLLHIGYRGTPV